jgi:hypothetical protein
MVKARMSEIHKNKIIMVSSQDKYEWIKKTWYIYLTEYYSAIMNKLCCLQKNG